MNYTDDGPGAAAWSAVECNVAIICASLPSLKALIAKMLPHMMMSNNRSRRARSRSKPSLSREEGLEYPLDQCKKQSIGCSGTSGSSNSEIQKHSNGITVTTVLSQESVWGFEYERACFRSVMMITDTLRCLHIILIILELLWHHGHYLEHLRQRTYNNMLQAGFTLHT